MYWEIITEHGKILGNFTCLCRLNSENISENVIPVSLGSPTHRAYISWAQVLRIFQCVFYKPVHKCDLDSTCFLSYG